MKTVVLGLLAETSLHPGAETGKDFIDLPVAREATTDYPLIPASSFKGSLRNLSKQAWKDNKASEEVFGKPDCAGGLAVSDVRLLLLPVRSLTGHYRWLTCPYLLERFQRDMRLAGSSISFEIARPDEETAYAADEGDLHLEELMFKAKPAAALADTANAIAPLMLHQSVQDRLNEQLVIVSDDAFRHFADYGLQVRARNYLEETTKLSRNLWYEESIPADTLFYSLLMARPEQENALAKVKELFSDRPYIQLGGNETLGQGWCAVTIKEGA